VSEELSLEGRTVLVTGAANGLGLAFARGFLNDGARVSALDIESLDHLADEGALPLVADVSDNGQVISAIEQVVRTTGRLDVLIANAGVAGQGEQTVDIGVRDSWQRALDSVVEAGGTPYAIPAGASDHPLGGLGFANWAREVAAQEAEHGLYFDHVVVCTVTGSTHAGIIAGFALEDRADRRLIGVDASATLEKTTEQVTRIARDTAAKIGVERDLRADEITIVDGYHAGIYGIPDEQTIDAIRTCARLEGMITDPVYEGKSMAGLIGMIHCGEIPAGSRVLYAHLGGQLCLSAYAGVL